MQKFEELKALIASLEGDADKFYNKGNSAAGTRSGTRQREFAGSIDSFLLCGTKSRPKHWKRWAKHKRRIGSAKIGVARVMSG